MKGRIPIRSGHPIRASREWKIRAVTLSILIAAAFPLGAADVPLPMIDNTHDRVQTSLKPGLKRTGTIKPRSAKEVGRSKIAIGCEMLPRNYGDFENFKAYIAPLGIKRIRIHAGWAKCEPSPGEFDFGWLDKQVDYCREQGLDGNSELTPCKWNARRLIGDLGHGIESLVFTFYDPAYDHPERYTKFIDPLWIRTRQNGFSAQAARRC